MISGACDARGSFASPVGCRPFPGGYQYAKATVLPSRDMWATEVGWTNGAPGATVSVNRNFMITANNHPAW